MMQAAEHGSLHSRYPTGRLCQCWLGGECSDVAQADRGLTPHRVAPPIPDYHLQSAFVEWNQEVEALPTKAPAKSFAHRVRLGSPHRRPQNSYTQVRET